MPTMPPATHHAKSGAERRKELDRKIEALRLAYKIRKAAGQPVAKLVSRIGVLTNRWHQARHDELMED